MQSRLSFYLISSTALSLMFAPLSAGAQSDTSTTGAYNADDEPGNPRDRRTEEHGSRTGTGTGGGGAVAVHEKNDHDAIIGDIGIGWFGVSNIVVDFDLDGDTDGIVAAPILGGRYWFSERFGIDIGLGIFLAASAAEIEGNGSPVETDGPSTFGLLLHGGFPIALKTGKHYTFIVVPELNVGFASVSRDIQSGVPGEATVEQSNTGFRLDLGGRAGAEIQFGFIGIPELALEASVGLYLTRIQARQEQGDVSASVSQTSISTTSLNNPWDFFRTTVAARYYF
jgi:hypothetical protein